MYSDIPDITTLRNCDAHFLFPFCDFDVTRFRVMVQIARGTPHGRDRERWGFTRDGGGRGGRRLSPEQRGYYERHERPTTTGAGGTVRRASWLEKYGPPERTDYRDYIRLTT